MVRCNLSILLAERNLKITKVSNDTGISRTTLTYLANNYSKGIQYDTLNTLCNYLHITPGDLISYVPVDVCITYIHRTGKSNEQLEIEAEITYNGITKTCGLCGNAFLSFPDPNEPYFTSAINMRKPDSVDIDISLWEPLTDADIDLEKENNFIKSALHLLPISFIKDIENEITNEIVNDLDYEYDLSTLSEPIATSFSWEPELYTF